MPFKLKRQKFETFQRSVLKMISLVVAGLCVVSFALTTLHQAFLKDRFAIGERHLKALGKFGQASVRPFPRYYLTRELEKGTVPPDKVLRILGHLMPSGLAIRRFEVNSSDRSLLMDLETSGLDESGNSLVEDLLHLLEETGFFLKLGARPVTGYAVSVYRVEGVFRDD
jgi:hypothetical protein